MIIVGDNLKKLLTQYNIIDNEHSFDETSITLRLDNVINRIEPTNNAEVCYGHDIPDDWIMEEIIPDAGFVLPSKGCVLACSKETVKIPIGYFGLIQTKGSLARLFILVHCCDGQVDPGFVGKLTFEICNLANFPVRLFAGQKIAQLFIIKTSTRQVKPYDGRYQGATSPTVQKRES